MKRALYIFAFLLISTLAGAQVNIYMGGNLQGNYSRIRGDEATFNPGFGGGFSFAYWEYEYWFLKSGLNYEYKHSSSLVYPDFYGVEPAGPDDKELVERMEHHLGIPLAVYFRPLERGENSMIVVAGFDNMITLAAKENSERFGEVKLEGNDIKTRIRMTIGLGIGYQRQLDRHAYMNIYPSFNVDVRSDRPFNSFTLTAEFLFGVY